jgi:hypothetical protein
MWMRYLIFSRVSIVMLMIHASRLATAAEIPRPIAFHYTVDLHGGDRFGYKTPADATSPDGTTILRVEGTGKQWEAKVRLYNAKTGQAVGPQIEAGRISALAVAPDNTTVAIAETNGGWDWGEVHVWNGTTGKKLRLDSKDTDGWGARPVWSMAFSKDGKTLSVVAGGTASK